ncbi:MAG TPA: LacI family DNA-binding transcriptional regulator [Spirochaetia bacterium]|nr:LacI family DNA-binding transcriptional regulator [Spirochaetia bacterium]
MQRRRVSSADVALRAGVSRTTVSFVLNNAPSKTISEETRQRVLEAAAELGYEPDINARRLALLRDKAVGLFVCQSQSIISDSYILRLIEGMSQVLNRKRYSLVLQPLRVTESNYVEIVEIDELDGVVLLNAHEDDAGIAELQNARVPLVVIGTMADRRIHQVDIDNCAAAEEMTGHLAALRHRRIAMIVHAPLVFHAATERLAGYRAGLKKAGLSYHEKLVAVADFTEESGRNAMETLLGGNTPPTAVFAGNDLIAYGAYKAIRDRGLSIPEDISVVGFDDDYPSRYLNPPLTTMSLPAAGLGSIAAGLVAQLIATVETEAKQSILPTRIAIRGSTRRL